MNAVATFLPRHMLAAPPARYVAALRNRLERWELEHLRMHAAELAAQLEAAHEEIAELKRSLSWAEDCAERWRDDALEARREDASTPGLTVDGRIVRLPSAGSTLGARA